MGRRPRLQFPGAVYHVMSRGNRKAAIFEDDDDRRLFLHIVGDASTRYDVRIYSLCQMGNHYHLVLDTPRGNLSDAMRHLNGVYSQTWNRRHGRSGHMFEARFRSLVIQRETYLKRSNRYVVRNPVRAHLTTQVAEWPWSTYRATAGDEEPPAWLYLDWLDWAFDARSRAEAQQKYREYVNSPTSRHAKIDTRALVIGSKAFKAAVAEAARLRQADRLLPAAMASAAPPLETLFQGIDARTGRRREVIVDAHVTYGYHFAEIAAHLGIHPTAVSKLFARQQRRNQHSRDTG